MVNYRFDISDTVVWHNELIYQQTESNGTSSPANFSRAPMDPESPLWPAELIADMEEEMRVLDERLGGATAERAALVQRLEAQARVKEQFEQVEKMFTPGEARVFREGDTIILRLVGLTFDSGASQIRPESFDLLAKVEKAIDVFPRSELIIEGHTDSHGGDDFNQKLSQDRAESVQQYMINAMRIPTYRLIATGYGETRPVASNETESGRARNRRIDIVIRPNLESS